MVQRTPGNKILWTAVSLLCLVTQGHTIALNDLIDRAVQLSDQLHFVSTSLKTDLDSHLPLVGKKIPRLSLCHTSSLKTPTEKSQALSLAESELLSLVQSLLFSWTEPLVLLSSEALSLPHPLKGSLFTKAKQLQEDSLSLGTGLDKLASRMGSSSQFPVSFNKSNLEDKESRLVNFHFLLSCFRRDSHKIDNFLKILRCKANKQIC